MFYNGLKKKDKVEGCSQRSANDKKNKKKILSAFNQTPGVQELKADHFSIDWSNFRINWEMSSETMNESPAAKPSLCKASCIAAPLIQVGYAPHMLFERLCT